MTPATQAARVREMLAAENPDALTMDGFDDALVGVARRCGQPALAAYCRRRCIDVLKRDHGMATDEANEYFEHNCAGAWMGPNSPVVIEWPPEGG